MFDDIALSDRLGSGWVAQEAFQVSGQDLDPNGDRDRGLAEFGGSIRGNILSVGGLTSIHNYYVTTDDGAAVLVHNITQGAFCGVPLDEALDIVDDLVMVEDELRVLVQAGELPSDTIVSIGKVLEDLPTDDLDALLREIAQGGAPNGAAVSSGAVDLANRADLLVAAQAGTSARFADFVRIWADPTSDYVRFIEPDGLRRVMGRPNADELLRDLEFPVSLADQGIPPVPGTTGMIDFEVVRYSQSSITETLWRWHDDIGPDLGG